MNKSTLDQSGSTLGTQKGIGSSENPIEAQRSGFDGERRHSGRSEFSPTGGNEGSETCGDAAHVPGKIYLNKQEKDG